MTGLPRGTCQGGVRLLNVESTSFKRLAQVEDAHPDAIATINGSRFIAASTEVVERDGSLFERWRFGAEVVV